MILNLYRGLIPAEYGYSYGGVWAALVQYKSVLYWS